MFVRSADSEFSFGHSDDRKLCESPGQLDCCRVYLTNV